jgi:predicted RNase H-like nuclease (RuvC/YqgF family)
MSSDSERTTLKKNIEMYETTLKDLERVKKIMEKLMENLETFSNDLTPIKTNTHNDNRHSNHIAKVLKELQSHNTEIQSTKRMIVYYKKKLEELSGGGIRKIKVVKKVKSPKKPIRPKSVKQVRKRK